MELALNQDWLKFLQWIWRIDFQNFFNVFSLFRFNIREGHCQSFEQTYTTLTKIVLIKLANRFRYDIVSFLETDVRTDRQTDGQTDRQTDRETTNNEFSKQPT